MLKVGISGATGRMGRSLMEAVNTFPEVAIGAALVRAGSPHLGSDYGEIAGTGSAGVRLQGDLAAAIAQIDVLIDFSTPQNSLENLALCAEQGIPVVLGTTGFSEKELDAINRAAAQIPLCMAANFSTGVNLCLQLLHLAAGVLGDDVDIEIVEAHHRHKVDAPSGTALAMGHEIAAALGRDPKQVFRFVREGITGAREKNTIGFACIRAGDIVGEHQVIFATEGERIEIVHKASSRLAFSRGAVRAAQWLLQQPPGKYDMRDVLGLR
jgi:4-hydroxy-tetrahydrodipicolinate reductase